MVRDSVYDQTQTHPDADRACAVVKWSDIFMLEPEATMPGKMLLRCAGSGESAMRTLKDLFRKKATSTVKQRAGSLSLFLAWFNVNRPFEEIFPIKGDAVYDYACDCRNNKVGASRVETLLGTLKFVGKGFQFPGAVEAAASPRVEGASYGLFLNKAPRARARALPMLCSLLCLAECPGQSCSRTLHVLCDGKVEIV